VSASASSQLVLLESEWKNPIRSIFAAGSKALIITTRSVCRTTLPDEIGAHLAKESAVSRLTVSAHVPMSELVSLARAAVEFSPDAIISLGGGSAIDAGKWISLAVAAAEGDPARASEAIGRILERSLPEDAAPLPHIAIPTTASGAEFTAIAGVTDDLTRRKRVIQHPALLPGTVILDPNFTRNTPSTLWLSSAVRALDHAIEALYAPDACRETDDLASNAVRALFAKLPRSREASEDLEARAAIQLAAWNATRAARRAGTALSHGIGYALGGTFGVPHGICSCVTLPAVMQWNLPLTIAEQAVVTRAAGAATGRASDAEAAAIAPRLVRDLVSALGLPTRLRELSMLRQSDMAQVADIVFSLPHVASNPRRATGPGDISEILELAW
jgi:maleylacetate reductase